MGSRKVVLALLAALALSGPAHAQSDPSLFEPAPVEEVGAATPTDGGRSLVLLGLALAAVAGAGVLAGLAIRRPRAKIAEPAPPAATPSPDAAGDDQPRERSGRFRKGTEAFKRRPGRLRAARATAAEASASARMGMPVMFVDDPVAPAPAPEPERVWCPRVVSDLPPLPAFGSGAEPPPKD